MPGLAFRFVVTCSGVWCFLLGLPGGLVGAGGPRLPAVRRLPGQDRTGYPGLRGVADDLTRCSEVGRT